MNTIIKVMESLVKMEGWTVTRFDIQRYEHKVGTKEFVGYAGHLRVKEYDVEVIIHDNGSFEFCED